MKQLGFNFCKECTTPGSLLEVDNIENIRNEPCKKHRGSERFHELLREIGDLHDKKQKDYGTKKDPFANVRGSEDWGVPAWHGAMIRAEDKFRRLQKYSRDGVLENEGVEDSFKDLAVYALIALCLWEELHR